MPIKAYQIFVTNSLLNERLYTVVQSRSLEVVEYLIIDLNETFAPVGLTYRFEELAA